MENLDLNKPINWDELDDFDGRLANLLEIFFFGVEDRYGRLEGRRVNRLLTIFTSF
jgi:hypothetical protein